MITKKENIKYNDYFYKTLEVKRFFNILCSYFSNKLFEKKVFLLYIFIIISL